MSDDVMFVVGLGLLIVSLPVIISAITDRKLPILGIVLVIVGSVAITTAVARNPGGYSVYDIPEIVGRVFTGIAN